MTGAAASAPPDRRLGFAYTEALCSAIEATTGAIERSDPRAFEYRGARLRFAVERALFVGALNDDGLHAAFCEHADGRAAAAAADRSRLEQAVVGRLLAAARGAGTDGARFASGRVAERTRFGLARLRDRLTPGARGAGVAESAPGPGPRPVCFLIDAPKFVRFLAPLLAALERERVVLLSSCGDLEPQAGLACIELDYGAAARRLEARALGAALRDHAHLAGAYDLLLRELARLRPRCVFVVEGNSPHDELVNRACRRLGIPCVCIQHGWSPIVHTGFRNMSFTRMAVWGEGFRDLLAPANPEQRFAVTGSPAFAAEGGAAPIAEGRRAASFFLQPESRLIGAPQRRGLLELVRATAERRPGDLVLVREHPAAPLVDAERERLLALANVRLVPSESHSLREVVLASRVAVSIYSTSLVEAGALGTPALAFNQTSLPRYVPDLERYGVGGETADPGAALAFVERLLADDDHHASFGPALERFRARFFAGADARGPERIVRLLDELAPA